MKIWRLTAFLMVATAGAAHADVPGWCKYSGDERLDSYGSLTDLYAEDDPRDAVMLIVNAVCAPDDEAKGQAKQVEATRQKWSKKLNMTDADWADAVAWAYKGQAERNSPDYYLDIAKVAWSVQTPLEQYYSVMNSTTGASNRATDPAYLLDALGAKLTQAGRLAYITRCVADRFSDPAVYWAMCQPDIDAFDAKALATEVRGDTKYDGAKRMILRYAAYNIQPKLAEHAKAMQELVAKDAAYGQLFTIAKAAHKDFAGKVNAKYLALMGELDDARVTNSRKAIAGCTDKTWAAFQEVVAAIGAKRFAGIRSEPGNTFVRQAAIVIQGEPNGYLVALALNQCAILSEKTDYLTRVLGDTISRWPGARGPRTFSEMQMLAAGIVLDDRDARLDFPPAERPWIEGTISSGGGGSGVIASIKGATITFAKEKHKWSECVKGHSTNRVTQITSSGSVIYEYICDQETIKVDFYPPAPPTKVNPRYVGVLKPGMFVEVIEDVVSAAFPKGKPGAPAVVAGVAVK